MNQTEIIGNFVKNGTYGTMKDVKTGPLETTYFLSQNRPYVLMQCLRL